MRVVRSMRPHVHGAFQHAIDSNDWRAVTFARRPNARPTSVFRFYTAGP